MTSYPMRVTSPPTPTYLGGCSWTELPTFVSAESGSRGSHLSAECASGHQLQGPGPHPKHTPSLRHQKWLRNPHQTLGNAVCAICTYVCVSMCVSFVRMCIICKCIICTYVYHLYVCVSFVRMCVSFVRMCVSVCVICTYVCLFMR